MNESPYMILCVDDEENILHSLTRLLRKEGYNILSTTSTLEGLRLLKENDVHLVMSDLRMPGMSGFEFLAKVKEKHPDTIRIILTGYTEVDSMTESINKGHIYKFFLKPWDYQSLKIEIKQALEQYELMKANKKLHQKIAQKNEALRKINENLELLIQDRTRDLEVQNQALEISRAILDDLPFSIIGVSHEGMIVMLNKKAMDLMYNGMILEVGRCIADYFSGIDLQKITETITTDSTRILKELPFENDYFDIFSIPLSGKFKGKGIVLALQPIMNDR